MKLKIADGREVPNPEDLAMLQALYSRSPASVDEHLKKVDAKGSESFMSQYYVGYGHASIGDCGTTTLFIENVTMLQAKAIQQWPLYSGQEASTRYMDFANAEFVNPSGTPEGEEIQEAWRAFYLKAGAPLINHLRTVHPRNEGEDEAIYEKALKARSFDVLRAFLPAGAKTNLSWHTNLRQAADHLNWLMCHPFVGVRELALQIRQGLWDRYPNSFRMEDESEEVQQWRERVLHRIINFPVDAPDVYSLPSPGIEDLISHDMTNEDSIFRNRPLRAGLPHAVSGYGLMRSGFALDFGSYRDIQRHRRGDIRVPVLTTELGFEPWYLKQLPASLAQEVDDLLKTQRARIDSLMNYNRGRDGMPTASQAISAQDYIAMGYQVTVDVAQPLDGFVYRLELRSSKSVHPTLRIQTHREIQEFQRRFPRFKLHVDMDPDHWTVRRGTQTIEERK